jgi:hypothetical protein
MKTIKVFFGIFLLVFLLSSCMSLTHVVGSGASSGVVTENKQWYALWGLVPVNKVDSKAMADGATNYTITSQQKFVDLLISVFTGVASFNVKTVSVQK